MGFEGGGLRVGVGLVTSQYVRRGGVLHGGWGWILTSHCEEMGWGMWLGDWLLTSHRLTRPVSCSRDQILCKRAAFSGWLA